MTAPAPAPRPNGAPPPAAPAAPAVELTAKDQRRLREEARREAQAKFKAAEVERLTAAEAKKRGVPAPSSAPAAASSASPVAGAEPLDPTRTDADRRADAAVFLRGVVWPLASVGAWLFGYDLAELTDAMAKDDAASWVPLARRYRWLDLLFTWAGAPARLIARVKELKRKREPGAKESKA